MFAMFTVLNIHGLVSWKRISSSNTLDVPSERNAQFGNNVDNDIDLQKLIVEKNALIAELQEKLRDKQ